MSTMSTPNVGIYNFKNEVIAVPLFQLLQWKHALKIEMKLPDMRFKGGKKASTEIRKFLSVPRTYPIQDLFNHISDSLDSINQQLGIAA